MASSVKNSSGGLDITATTSTETLIGTSFNDTYIVSSLYNKFQDPGYGYGYGYGGVDTIRTSVLNALKTYTLGSWGTIENLTYTGTLAATLKGNSLNNVIKANASATVADTLYGDKGDDILYGYGGADNLQGGDGNDTLYAGVDTNVDVLIGGTGNDTYRDVTNDDIILETARGGFDTIVTNEKGGRYLDLRNFTNIEGLSYISKIAATLHGNNAANVINATGSAGAVSLFGYDGNDRLVGGSAVDKLDGGNGDDTLNGGAGADTMIGGNGNDIYLSDAADVITELANGGIDTIVGAKKTLADAAYANTIENLVYTGTDNATLTGNALNNVVSGGAGNNTVVGGTGNDVVLGGNGSDNVQGNTGDDILYGGRAAGIENSTALRETFIRNFSRQADGVADTLVGGDGSDIYLIDEIDDVISEISTDKGTDVILSSVDFSMNGSLNVEALVLDDSFTAASQAWYAEGSDRNDLIIGNSSENYIVGGLGNDILTGDFSAYGTAGHWYGQTNVTDVVDAGGGDDSLLAMTGSDSMLLGGAGNDFYVVMNANTDISDTAGSTDVLYLTVSDTGVAKDGIEHIVLAGGNATYDAKALDALNKVRAVAGMVDSERAGSAPGSGPSGSSPYAKLDAVPSSAAITAIGNNLANTMYGNEQNNTLSGGAGNDTLYGGAGNDTLIGDTGADRLVGGVGDDVYVVDASDTIVEAAGQGIDIIRSATLTSYSAYANIEGLEYTGTASVTLQNGTTNVTTDRLYGGAGNDTINGHGGDDTLRGNAGNDTINGGDGMDMVFGGLGADIVNGGAGNDQLFGDELVALYNYSYGPTTATGELGNTIHGDAGADTIHGGAAADKLYGDADNDLIYGGLGADLIEGGDGNDLLYAEFNFSSYSETSANTLNGGAGNDSLNGAAGADTLSGGDGNDQVHGDGGNDTINGGTGNDNLRGDAGNDMLNGGAGNDWIYGGDGNDTILADADGNDELYGDAGDDIIYAGTIVTGEFGLTGQDLMYGDSYSPYSTSYEDQFRFSESSLSKLATNGQQFWSGHNIADFDQGMDKIQLARTLAGDGDLAIESGIVKTTAGGTFSSAAELVIVSANVLDDFNVSEWGTNLSINASAVISALGTSDTAYAVGAERIFAVDDGYDSAVFKFTSKDASSTITVDELELVVTVVGQPSLALNDFGLY